MSKRATQAGFTLIELMVVLVILGLLFGIVGPRLFGKTEQAKRDTAMVQIRSFEGALHQYEIDNGDYPTTEQGLEALVSEPTVGPAPQKWQAGGYLEVGRVPDDPWGNPYVYIYPGNHTTPPFDITSYGFDGEPGGEGKFADINNWELE